jgi:hypothetical protein
MKLVFQQSPALHRWADLMSCSWQPPGDAYKARASLSAETEDVLPIPDVDVANRTGDGVGATSAARGSSQTVDA